jgi:hypothetical protein
MQSAEGQQLSRGTQLAAYIMLVVSCLCSSKKHKLTVSFNCKYILDYSVFMVKFMHMFISVNLLPLVGLHTVVLLCWHCNHGTICTFYCFYSFVCVFYVS